MTVRRSGSTASDGSDGTSSGPRGKLGLDLDFVAVNDITDAPTLAHLLKYDSVLGTLRGGGRPSPTDGITVDGDELRVLAVRDPAELPWKELGAQIVIESTGLFTDREQGGQAHRGRRREGHHQRAGQGRGPHRRPRRERRRATTPPQHNVISNASCTTNCVAPMAKVLDDAFGIEQGFMTTIHAYTNDQSILDLPAQGPSTRAGGGDQHHPDLDRRREGDRPRAAAPARAGWTGSRCGCRCRTARSRTSSRRSSARSRSRRSTRRSARRRGERPAVRRTTRLHRGPDRLQSDIVGSPASCTFDAALDDGDGQRRRRSSAGTTTSGATRTGSSTSSSSSPDALAPVRLRTLEDLGDVSGTRVFVRARPTTSRCRTARSPTTRASGRACPRSRELLERGASVVAASHLGGRRDGSGTSSGSRRSRDRLGELLGTDVVGARRDRRGRGRGGLRASRAG